MIAVVVLATPSNSERNHWAIYKFAMLDVYMLKDATATARRHWKAMLADESDLEVLAFDRNDGIEFLFKWGIYKQDFDTTMPQQ